MQLRYGYLWLPSNPPPTPQRPSSNKNSFGINSVICLLTLVLKIEWYTMKSDITKKACVFPKTVLKS